MFDDDKQIHRFMSNVEEYARNQVDWRKEGSIEEPQYKPIPMEMVSLKISLIEMTGASQKKKQLKIRSMKKQILVRNMIPIRSRLVKQWTLKKEMN